MSQLLTVEVFPLAVGRWIAVLDGPAGAFSTEAETPEGVLVEVEASLREVLGGPLPPYRLSAPDGRDWTAAVAEEQAAALNG